MKKIICAIACASLLNIAPMLFFTLGGDTFFHYPMLTCFAHQFWQGDLYPRWCMAANNGLGTPALLMYFPLSYYVGALLYPLGLPVAQLYVLSLFLATFFTGLTCYAWLKDSVSPGRALLVAVLFLFLPYRMEAMLFRSAYAEIWAIAFLPLLCKYVRRLARGEAAALPLIISCALLILSHVPCAATGFIAGGIYMLVVAPQKLWRYGVCVAASACLCAFYLVPAAYASGFMAVHGSDVWVNNYLGLHNLTVNGQWQAVLTMAIGLLVLAVLAIIIIWKRARLESFVRREVIAWGVAALVALFLLLPVSAPVYALLGPLSQVVLPWRIQSVFLLALAFLAAVWMQHFAKAKTWRGDYALALGLLVLMSYLVSGVHTENYGALVSDTLRVTAVSQPEYRTRWTDETHYGHSYFLAREDTPVEILEGGGGAQIMHWGWDGIDMRTNAPGPLRLRLGHLYFPAWSARVDGAPLALQPEEGSGQILLDVPAGAHEVRLRFSLPGANPVLIGGAYAVSLFGWLFLLVIPAQAGIHRKRHGRGIGLLRRRRGVDGSRPSPG